MENEIINNTDQSDETVVSVVLAPPGPAVVWTALVVEEAEFAAPMIPSPPITRPMTINQVWGTPAAEAP